MIERVDIGVVQPAAVIERILDELEARHAHRLHEDMVGAAGAAHHDMVRPHRRERRQPFAEDRHQDRKSVVQGTSVSVRVDLRGRRIIQKTRPNPHEYLHHTITQSYTPLYTTT